MGMSTSADLTLDPIVYVKPQIFVLQLFKILANLN